MLIQNWTHIIHITLQIFLGGEIEHVLYVLSCFEHYAELLNSIYIYIYEHISRVEPLVICVSCFCGDVLFFRVLFEYGEVSGSCSIACPPDWFTLSTICNDSHVEEKTWSTSPSLSHNARTWICLSKISNSWTLDGLGVRSTSFPWHWDGFFWKNWGETEGIDWVSPWFHQIFAVSTLVL